MRRQFIWIQSALCAVTFSMAAPVLARANSGQPPPHAQANGHDKNKNKDKNKDKDKDKDKQASQAKARAWDQRFHGLDRNRNNVVSRAEWNGDDRSFSSHDWNRDGVLSGDELIAGAKPDQNRAWDPRFNGLDRNRNNVVSRAEWNGDDRSFATHDWNRDGVLSGDELIAGATRPVATRPNAGPPEPRPRTESDEVLFTRRDVNRDNVVSRSEWVGSASEFDRLDRNKDGVLSPYEYGVGR